MADRKLPRPVRVSDMDLWERVRKSAKPLEPGKRNHQVQDTLKSYLKSNAISTQENKLVSAPSLSPEPKLRSNTAILDQNTWRKISKGRVSIDRRIDLHGLTHDEAYEMLIQFLDMAGLEGARTVLVITGKGRMGEGVLRRSLPNWLAAPAIRHMVAGYREAHSAHGGGGAWYIRLRKREL